MFKPSKKRCEFCESDEIDGPGYESCEHVFCRDCAEIAMKDSLHCPLCMRLTSMSMLPDRLVDTQCPTCKMIVKNGLALKCGKHKICTVCTLIWRKPIDDFPCTICWPNSSDGSQSASTDKKGKTPETMSGPSAKIGLLTEGNCYQCKKKGQETKAEHICVGCGELLCSTDAKRHTRLGILHKDVIPYSRQTPIKKDKRMAGEAAQATTKAKEMHQKVNTARKQVRAQCNQCLMKRIIKPAIHMCTDCWEKLCEGCHKDHNQSFEHHYIVGIGAHLKPEEKAAALTLPPSKPTCSDTCKTHNERLCFGCAECYFFVCNRCYGDEQSIKKECTRENGGHVFKSLKALNLLVEARVATGMHFVHQYSVLAAELTVPVLTPEVSSVVDTLKEKVQELILAMQEMIQGEKEEKTSDQSEASDMTKY